MPPAIAAVTSALVAAGLSATAAAIGAYVLVTAATIGFSAGANALINAVFGPSRPAPSDGQIVSKESIGSRKRHYGIVHTSGQETFKESRDGILAQVLTLGTGQENEVIEHRIHNKPVTLDAGGFVTQTSFHGAVSIHTRSGSDDQLAIGEVTTVFPEWTADHRQRGCAHTAILSRPVDAEDFSEVYNSREPAYTQVRKAVGVYDPRKDDTALIGTDEAGEPVYGVGAVRLADPTTWPWSDNWALVTADYFAHPDGFGAGFDQVNWANIAGEADVCDQTLTTASAETIARWRLWASYSLAREKRADILASMLKCGDGFAWQDAEGKFNLMCGRWVEPDLVITDDQIMSLSAAQGPDGYQSIRAVKVLYTEAAADYREQESATIGSLETDDDGEPQQVEAFYAPHHNQAARIGKLVLAELSPDRWRVKAVLNLLGLDTLGRRFARLDSAKLGLSFWVKLGAPRLDLTNLRVEISMTQVEPGDWDFDAETEEGTPPVADGGAGRTPSIESIANLTLSAVPIGFGETSGVAIAAAWDPPTRAGLLFEAEFRETGSETWLPMTTDRTGGFHYAQSGPVTSGTEYEVRVRATSIAGRPGAWSGIETITPVAQATLEAPTSLSAIGDTGKADISFGMPNGSAVDHVKLYGAGTDDFGSATQVGSDINAAPGSLVTVEETGLSAGTRYYWARSFDAEDNGSAAIAGPAAATIT